MCYIPPHQNNKISWLIKKHRRFPDFSRFFPGLSRFPDFSRFSRFSRKWPPWESNHCKDGGRPETWVFLDGCEHGRRRRQNFWVQRAGIFVPLILAQAPVGRRLRKGPNLPVKTKCTQNWNLLGPFVWRTKKAIQRNGFLLHSKYRQSKSISLDRTSLFWRLRSHLWCIQRAVENSLPISLRTLILRQIWD